MKCKLDLGEGIEFPVHVGQVLPLSLSCQGCLRSGHPQNLSPPCKSYPPVLYTRRSILPQDNELAVIEDLFCNLL